MADNYGIGTNGKPINPADSSESVEFSTSTTPAAKVKSGDSITSIVGNNLGIGHGIYAGSNIGAETVVDFRTIVSGIGISIQTDANSLTITNTQSKPDLGSLTGTLLVEHGGTGLTEIPNNSILVGIDAGQLGVIQAPTSANTALHWNGITFEWKAADSVPVDTTEPIDAYTKDEVDALIAGIPTPETIDTYTKTEVDAKFAALPAEKEVYTKAEVDALLAALPSGSGSSLPLIRKPVNMYPENQQVVYDTYYELQESEFRDVYQVGHGLTHYLLSTNPDCSAPYVFDVMRTFGLAGEFEIGQEYGHPSLDRLQPSSTYYWKARQKDQEGLWSEWSDVTMFTTSPDFVTGNGTPSTPTNGAPSIIAPTNGATAVSISPWLEATAADVVFDSESLESSSWEIFDTSNIAEVTPLLAAYNVTTDPTRYQVMAAMPVWMLTDPAGGGLLPSLTAVASNGDLYAIGEKYSSAWNDDKNWVVKYNKDGDILWQKNGMAPGTNPITCLMVDAADNVYLAGSHYVESDAQLFVTKLSAVDGSVIWSKTSSLTIGDQTSFVVNPQNMVMDSDLNLYISGDAYNTANGESCSFIIKSDNDLNIIWQKTLDQDTNLKGAFVTVDAAGNSYLAARAYPDKMHLVAMAFSPTGTILWQTQLRDITQFANLTCALSDSGTLVIFGAAHVNWIWHPLVVKVRTSDGFVMSQSFIDVETREYHNIALDANDNLYIVGSEEGDNYGYTMLSKYADSGECVWRKRISAQDGGSLVGKALAVDGDFIFVQLEANSTSRDMLIVKFDLAGKLPHASIGVAVSTVDLCTTSAANYTIEAGIVTTGTGMFTVEDEVATMITSTYEGSVYGFSLAYDTTYYARVKYTGDINGDTAWSELSQFTTGQDGSDEPI